MTPTTPVDAPLDPALAPFATAALQPHSRYAYSEDATRHRVVGRAPGRLARWYGRRGPSTRAVIEITFALLAPLCVGYAVLLPLAYVAPLVLEVAFWSIMVSLLATSLLIGVECARATRFPEPPGADVADDRLPYAATVISAYLPNEVDTLLDSISAHLALDYPHERHVVVVAYNDSTEPGSDRAATLEQALTAWARTEPRLLPIRVTDSTSKAENINAVLAHLDPHVEFVGFFDADHRPDPTSMRRAARWLADASGPGRFDAVQGQCVVRNPDQTWLTRTVAAEFATIYAVSHPGRTVFNDFGIFGGSNGWWRTETVASLGMDPAALTEDIDLTARALLTGRRLGTDPRIVSTELAPRRLRDLWAQRMRWAQGWWEVSVRHTAPLLRARHLSGSQRRGVALLMGWRAIHPWLAALMLPIVLARLTPPNRPDINLDLLLFLATTAIVNGIPLLQALVANRVAAPPIAGRTWLFWRYALVSVLGYSLLKAVVNRAATLRHLLHANDWVVTPRALAPSTAPSPRD